MFSRLLLVAFLLAPTKYVSATLSCLTGATSSGSTVGCSGLSSTSCGSEGNYVCVCNYDNGQYFGGCLNMTDYSCSGGVIFFGEISASSAYCCVTDDCNTHPLITTATTPETTTTGTTDTVSTTGTDTGTNTDSNAVATTTTTTTTVTTSTTISTNAHASTQESDSAASTTTISFRGATAGDGSSFVIGASPWNRVLTSILVSFSLLANFN